jgi:hypothetical protein
VYFAGSYWYVESSFTKTYVVYAVTEIKLEQGSGIKGERAMIRGRLLDDRGDALSDKPIYIYWKYAKGETPILAKSVDGKYTPPYTDANGSFEYSGFEIPADQPVGRAFIEAKFMGTPEEDIGPRNAYLPCEIKNIPFNVSAYTTIEVDDDDVDKDLIRGRKFMYSGCLYELYKGEPLKDRPVGDMKIEFYLYEADATKLPDEPEDETDTLIDDPRTDENEKGRFEFIIHEVSKKLKTGMVKIKLVFEGNANYIGCENVTLHRLRAYTEIKVHDYPKEIKEGEKFRIRIQLVEEERSTAGDPVYIKNAVIWLNISAPRAGFYNYTKTYTNEIGVVDLNYTGLYQTRTGKVKRWNTKQELEIEVVYTGYHVVGGKEIRDYFRFPTRTNMSTVFIPKVYKPPELSEWERNKNLYIFIIVAAIIFVIVAFLTAVWRKHARIRGMKAIIKRAADQLVAGNEYTAVIFKSYQKLGAHLRKYGYLRREAETFKEFEEAVKAALPIDRYNMDRFMRLLEEARYSHHTITPAHRDQAIASLRAIEASLSRIIIDEAAAMKALERLEGVEAPETEIVVRKKEAVPPTPGQPPGAPPPQQQMPTVPPTRQQLPPQQPPTTPSPPPTKKLPPAPVESATATTQQKQVQNPSQK